MTHAIEVMILVEFIDAESIKRLRYGIEVGALTVEGLAL